MFGVTKANDTAQEPVKYMQQGWVKNAARQKQHTKQRACTSNESDSSCSRQATGKAARSHRHTTPLFLSTPPHANHLATQHSKTTTLGHATRLEGSLSATGLLPTATTTSKNMCVLLSAHACCRDRTGRDSGLAANHSREQENNLRHDLQHTTCWLGWSAERCMQPHSQPGNG